MVKNRKNFMLFFNIPLNLLELIIWNNPWQKQCICFHCCCINKTLYLSLLISMIDNTEAPYDRPKTLNATFFLHVSMTLEFQALFPHILLLLFKVPKFQDRENLHKYTTYIFPFSWARILPYNSFFPANIHTECTTAYR